VQDDIEMITAIMPLPEHVRSLVICIVGAPVWIHTVQGAVDDLRSLNFVHTESLFFSKTAFPLRGRIERFGVDEAAQIRGVDDAGGADLSDAHNAHRPRAAKPAK
jgi:hypothetical protein